MVKSGGLRKSFFTTFSRFWLRNKMIDFASTWKKFFEHLQLCWNKLFSPWNLFHFEYEHIDINQYSNIWCALCRLYNRQCFQTLITFLFISILLLRNQLIILLLFLWLYISKWCLLTKITYNKMYFCMIK